MDPEVRIGDHVIGPDAPPFIVAEMSANHNQSLDRALEIVDAVAAAGAHALKLQTYTADTMTIEAPAPEFSIEDPTSLWNGETLHELYDKAHTPWEWHRPILARCRERGLIAFSTPFDASAVEFLEQLAVPCYKIASFENVDIPLIRTVAATGKPVIISTGMASVLEIAEAVETVRAAGNHKLILLKCTSSYPAPVEDANLATIPHMAQLFRCPVGLSDHTLGVGVAVAAVALGATIVEKHVALSRADGGVDAAFSLEPEELRSLVVETGRAWRARGSVRYGPTETELPSLRFRRSLYVVEDIHAGEIITENHIRAIRPGLGLAPKFIDDFIGKRAAREARRGTAVKWDLLRSRGQT
jgi:N-acetylneuraminate synthase